MKNELLEAIEAGERALNSLRAAQTRLNSAGNWGLFDLLGGGLIAGLMKHSKLNDASGLLEEAKRDIRAFQRELRDVELIEDLSIDVGDFLSFADLAFDNVVADFLVQRKISQAQEQLDRAERQVDSITAALKRKYRELNA